MIKGWIRFTVVLCTSMAPFVMASPDRSAAQTREDSLKTEAVGVGSWKSDRDTIGNRDWQVQLQRSRDGSLAGEIVIVGSPYLHRVRMEGRVDGDDVYGVLVNDGNQQIGTFTGAISDVSAHGKYTTTEGDSGTWSWTDPKAARALKDDGQR